jgi:hypothetical protein
MVDSQLVNRLWPAENPLQRNSLLPFLEKAKKKWDIQTYFGIIKNPIGVEVEVEKAPAPKNYTFWQVTEDGSLKDKGMEYVSIPVYGKCIDYALHELSETLTKHNCSWSHRTSIHVHNNVSALTFAQLRAFVGVYAALEELFFSFVREERRGNPYCYHITDLHPTSVDFGNHDMKYCALNVGNCLVQYNTVEFRHLQGTDDFRQIRRWIQLITKLHIYITTNKPEEVVERVTKLNTTSEYSAFVKDVFKTSAVLFNGYDLKAMMEEGVLWSKVYFSYAKGEL